MKDIERKKGSRIMLDSMLTKVLLDMRFFVSPEATSKIETPPPPGDAKINFDPDIQVPLKVLGLKLESTMSLSRMRSPLILLPRSSSFKVYTDRAISPMTPPMTRSAMPMLFQFC